jgi:hypothetical protein
LSDDSGNPLAPLAPFGRAAEKLIELVNEHLAAELRPRRIRRDAQAEADAQMIALDGEVARAARAMAWEDGVATRRQGNREAILVGTAERLKALPPGTIAEERVDPDWASRFFTASEDASDEHVRSLWSELLAGEVAKPGSFSIRTLEAVRTMGRRDAELFESTRQFLFEQHSGTPLVWFTSAARAYMHSKGVHLGVLDYLSDAGLLSGGDARVWDFTLRPVRIVRYFGNGYSIEGTPAQNGVVQVRYTGAVGGELSRICGGEPDREFERVVVTELRQMGLSVDPVETD